MSCKKIYKIINFYFVANETIIAGCSLATFIDNVKVLVYNAPINSLVGVNKLTDEKIEISDNKSIEENLVVSEYESRVFTATPLEESTIKKAICGDNDAFETIFMGTYRYVFAVARKYLSNDQDIYDAIQDTYTRVYKGLPRLDSAESFYPWLYRIAVNCSKDILNDISHNATVPLNDEATVTDKTISSDVCADVSEVLKQLPPEQAELLIRVYYDKMRVAEIARMQGVPSSTVHNRLKAAKKKLKELLKIRGIDKPLYSGEFISMISTALRDIIGTELLSMAIAEEILHNVTGGKDNKGAFVVSAFARKMRNKAVKNIAAILLLTCLLTTTLVIFLVNIIIKNFSGKENVNAILSTNSTVSEYIPPISSDTTTSLESTVVDSSATSSTVSDNPSSVISSSLPSTPSSLPTEPPQNEVMTFAGSFESSENFGTFVENGYMHIVSSGNYIYGWQRGDSLYSVKKDGTSLDYPAYGFGAVYDESGCFLNVFDNNIYWISTNDQSQFVLNRYYFDDDGNYFYTHQEILNKLYSKVFDDGDCTFVKNMLVANDGVYFIAGTEGSATLYRTDYDFNVKDSISDIADFGIINDKIYYLYGKGNYGVLYSADRADFGNKTCVSHDNLSYGSISTIGEFLILDPSNEHGQSKYKTGTDCIVIDTVSGKVVRTIHANPDDNFTVHDASEYKGGTLIYTHNGENKMFNITTGKTEEATLPLGTIFGDYKYYHNGCFFQSDIYDPKKCTVLH